MYETTKTIFHTQLELQRALRKGFTPMPYSTLNEKFNVAVDEDIQADQYPDLHYIAIGRGAHLGSIDNNGNTLIDILEHDITDATLYEHLPFIMRRVDEDLTSAQRAKYAMRVLVEKNGIQYFAYYLKRVDLQQSHPEVLELYKDGETIASRDYTPTPAQLTPTPMPLSATQENISSGKKIAVLSEISVILTEDDINEIIEAATILYGDVRYATVSEIATVTAIPKTINVAVGGVNVTYEEAVMAQIANHIPSNYSLQFSSTGIEAVFSLGHTSPYIR